MSQIKQYKPQILMATLSAVLSGCSAVTEPVDMGLSAQQEQVCVSTHGVVVECPSQMDIVQENNHEDSIELETSRLTHPLEASDNSVLLGEYIEQLSTDLLKSMTVPVQQATVGVTSFVEFTPTLSSVNLLGNMLAESFIYELQQNGIPVVDYKIEKGVRVKDSGDFVFSRDTMNLRLENTMQYVLAGTLMYNKRGIIVNARMVDFESKQVVASAKKLIPFFVLDSIVPTSAKNSVVMN